MCCRCCGRRARPSRTRRPYCRGQQGSPGDRQLRRRIPRAPMRDSAMVTAMATAARSVSNPLSPGSDQPAQCPSQLLTRHGQSPAKPVPRAVAPSGASESVIYQPERTGRGLHPHSSSGTAARPRLLSSRELLRCRTGALGPRVAGRRRRRDIGTRIPASACQPVRCLPSKLDGLSAATASSSRHAPADRATTVPRPDHWDELGARCSGLTG